MAVNKVVTIDGSTLMDISDTTAVATDVASGKYFYTASGVKTAGTASGSGGSSGQTVTGTVTGSGTTILQIPCSFEPDLIHLYGDLSGDVSLRGVTILTIIKDVVLYQAQDGSGGSVNESSWFIRDITGYNESDTVNTHASYSNGVLTIDTVANSAGYRFAEGITYSYELSTIGTGGGGSSTTLITKTIAVNGTYSAQDDSADGYSSVTVNVPPSGITPTGSINITTNGTHDVTNYASAVVSVSGGGTPSATQHTILFEFEDTTAASITAYYDSTFISNAITATVPTTYDSKTVTSAQLDGVTWYEPANIPLNTQLINYNDVLTGYVINKDGSIISSEQWNCVTDYTEINSSMTFTFACSQYSYIGFYDKNKNAIQTVSADNIKDSAEDYFAFGTLDSSIIPINAAYIVMQGNSYVIEELSLIRTA